MSHRPVNRLWLAIGGIVAIVIAVYLIFAQRIPFVDGYRVNGVFQSANELIPGSPVRIAGVDVGRVTGIHDGPGATAIVEMELDDAARPVHTDARMRIKPRLFLEGGFAVDLEPGSPTAPEVPDDGTVPLAQTAVPVQFDQILGMFKRPTRQSLQAFLAELDRALGDGGAEALAGTWRPLEPLLRDAARVAEAARGQRPHDLSDTVGSGARIASALADRERELVSLVGSLHTTTAALASRDAQLAASLRELDGLLAELPGALDSADRALPALERFTAALRPSLRAAPPVLGQATDVLDQVAGLVRRRELPGLVDDLGPAVRRLPRLEERLIALFERVTPVTECVRRNALPVLLADVPDREHSTNRPVWQDLVHSMVGLASASQNFDGNGYAIRYLAGVGEQAISTGTVPGLGQLVGTANSEILGARPLWLGPGVEPPYRPDATCVEQPLPDLDARTQPAPVTPARRITRHRPALTEARLRQALRRLQREARR